MKKFWLGALVLFFAAVFSGCQAFLEDYSYQPLGPMSSGSSY